MALLRIEVLGGLAVPDGGPLPASRKTRALLAFLVLTRRPQRRERLCEIFWEVPDDPRGALRWSLSKLRGVIGAARLNADRERISVVLDDIAVDVDAVTDLLDDASAAREALLVALENTRQPLLAGLDLPGAPTYQAWLTAERDDAERLHLRLLARLAGDPAAPPHEALKWCREWATLEPAEPAMIRALSRTLTRLGRGDEADAAAAAFRAARLDAGLAAAPLDAPAPAAAPPAPAVRAKSEERALKQHQRIRFATAPDGVRVAYATVGDGPPLVKAANWLGHLELDWDAPIWAPLFRELARGHRFIRYDERGNGLSDWDVEDLSFDAFVADLECVVEAAGVARFPLLGISQGAAVAIEYAARHPARVSQLILWGGYAAGWRHTAAADEAAERAAVITLVRAGWGRADPAYRQLFTASFLPDATPEELDWFNAFQRQTASAANAARFLESFAKIDVRHRLADIRCPTLVMHARGDQRIPLASGIALAAGIPGAELVTLESDNHLLLGREAASAEFVAQVRRFCGTG